MSNSLPQSTPLVSKVAEALEAYTHVVNAVSRQRQEKGISQSQRKGLKELETNIESALRVEMRSLRRKMDRILNRENVNRGSQR